MTRHTTAAFAWIERPSSSGRLVLAQWNRKWKAFNLVGGHQEPGETVRQCVAREVAEELSLVDGEDFVVGQTPLACVDFSAWSVPAAAWTAYDMTVFETAIAHEAAYARIDANADNRWLSVAELSRGETTDGRTVSEVATRFFAALNQLAGD